jgi:hypothetical protein
LSFIELSASRILNFIYNPEKQWPFYSRLISSRIGIRRQIGDELVLRAGDLRLHRGIEIISGSPVEGSRRTLRSVLGGGRDIHADPVESMEGL